MFNNLQIKTLTILITSKDWVTSESLSEYLNLNKKTLQNNIHEILELCGDECIIESGKHGYYLSYISDRLIKEIRDRIDWSGGTEGVEKRTSSIILYLLFLHDNISMQTLADLFFLSKTAMSRELDIVKRWIMRSGVLSFETSNTKGVRIIGDEKYKRIYCAKFANLETFDLLPFISEIKSRFFIILNDIKNMIPQMIDTDGIIISGNATEALSKYLAISILRTEMGYYRDRGGLVEDRKKEAEKIASILFQNAGYSLNEAEIDDLQMYLQQIDFIYLEDKNINQSEISNSIKDIENLLGLDAETFTYDPVVPHYIKRIVLRAKAGFIQTNNNNYSIIAQYPLEAHLVNVYLKEYFNIEPNKETSNIALFLGESFNKYRKNIRVLFVCNESYPVINQIKRILNSIYAVREITVVTSYILDQMPETADKYNLIVTTVTKVALCYQNVIYIPCILDDKDIDKLENAIKAYSYNIREENIKKLKDLYYIKLDIANENDDYIVELLELENIEKHSFQIVGKDKMLICNVDVSSSRKLSHIYLSKPIRYSGKKIREILYAQFPSKDPDIFDYFALVSALLKQ